MWILLRQKEKLFQGNPSRILLETFFLSQSFVFQIFPFLFSLSLFSSKKFTSMFFRSYICLFFLFLLTCTSNFISLMFTFAFHVLNIQLQENITQTFIVLNTNLYYNNKANTSETDPCGQVSNF